MTRSSQSGMTLVELMITMTLTTMLVGIVFTMLVQLSTAYRSQGKVSDLQQTLTAAQGMIVRDVRQAGLMVPNGYRVAYDGDFHQAVVITDESDEPDTIVVGYADPSAQAVVTAWNEISVTVDDADLFEAGDLAVISQPIDRAQSEVLDPQGFLTLSLARAHDRVVRLGDGVALDHKPRATCAACLVQDGGSYWAHVGDSRVYQLRAGTVRERTRDHSHVELLLREGLIAESEMRGHPMRNFVECCIGGDVPLPDMSITARKLLSPGDVLLTILRLPEPPRHVGRLPRLEHVDKVMRDPGSFRGVRLGGADVHAPVHGHGIHGHDLRAQPREVHRAHRRGRQVVEREVPIGDRVEGVRGHRIEPQILGDGRPVDVPVEPRERPRAKREHAGGVASGPESPCVARQRRTWQQTWWRCASTPRSLCSTG